MEQFKSQNERIQEAEKRKRRLQWLSVLLLGIMVFSSIGYSFFSNPDSRSKQTVNQTEQNGIVQEGGYWSAQYNGEKLLFSSNPESSGDVPYNTSIKLGDIAGKKVYFYDNSLQQELSLNLARYSELRQACYGACNEDLPEKNCSGQEVLIVWNRSAENRVSQEDKCVFIDGGLTSVDAFLYRLFNLI